MSLTFKKSKKRMQRYEDSQRYFWQDDCGKIIKKLLNHLAIIILRIQKGIEIRFIFAFFLSLGVCFSFLIFAGSKKLAALVRMTALHFSTRK